MNTVTSIKASDEERYSTAPDALGPYSCLPNDQIVSSLHWNDRCFPIGTQHEDYIRWLREGYEIHPDTASTAAADGLDQDLLVQKHRRLHQAVLGPTLRQWAVVLGELALQDLVDQCPPEVALVQIEHLIAIATCHDKRTVLRVLPTRRHGLDVIPPDFAMLEIAGTSSRSYVATKTVTGWTRDPSQDSAVSATLKWTALNGASLTGEQTLGCLRYWHGQAGRWPKRRTDLPASGDGTDEVKPCRR